MSNPWVMYLNILYWYRKRRCKKNMEHYPMLTHLGVHWNANHTAKQSVCRFCGKKILMCADGYWFDPYKLPKDYMP